MSNQSKTAKLETATFSSTNNGVVEFREFLQIQHNQALF